MKTVDTTSAGSIVGGVKETVQFTIAAHGKLIRNVISSIYSKKEETVVRELMANAFDAHIMAGKTDVPIDVFLPSYLDPTFIVRDFGVGMTHDFVMRLFSVIGFSTKEDTNDQTGMFGVGSKSPLSISDTFSVRCFDAPGWNGAPYLHNGADLNATGRIRMYTISISEANVPQINHTFDVLPSIEDRVEQGGVEVKVPVRGNSWSKILDGVVSQHFCWFDKAVNFGGAYADIEKRLFSKILKIAPGMYIAKRLDIDYSGHNRGAFVRQGAATYPLSVSSLTESIYLSAETRKIAEQASDYDSNLCILFDVPIGTFDATMAREAIQYNAVSCDNLAREIGEIVRGFGDNLLSFIDDSVWSYPLAIQAIQRELSKTSSDFNGYAAKQLIADFVRTFSSMFQSRIEANLERAIVENSEEFAEFTVPHGGAKRIHATEITRTRGVMLSWPYLATERRFRDSPENVRVRAVTYNEIFYIIPPQCPDWKARITTHIENHVGEQDRCWGKVTIPVVVIRTPKSNIGAVLDELKRAGVYTEHFTSDDLPKLTTTESRTPHRDSVYQYYSKINGWDEVKVKANIMEPAYYVVRKGASTGLYGAEFSRAGYVARDSYESSELRNVLERAGANQPYGLDFDSTLPVYRITASQLERFMKVQTFAWKPLFKTLCEGAVVRYENLNEPSLIIDAYSYVPNFPNERMLPLLVSSAPLFGTEATIARTIRELMRFSSMFRLSVAAMLIETAAWSSRSIANFAGTPEGDRLLEAQRQVRDNQKACKGLVDTLFRDYPAKANTIHFSAIRESLSAYTSVFQVLAIHPREEDEELFNTLASAALSWVTRDEPIEAPDTLKRIKHIVETAEFLENHLDDRLSLVYPTHSIDEIAA